MNFKDLKIIVSQIKRTILCNKCKKSYRDEEIEVIGTPDGEQYYFHAFCPKCQIESILYVTIDPMPAELHLPNFKKLGNAPRMGQISANEVLDMHNFLQQFDGNFGAVFKKTT